MVDIELLASQLRAYGHTVSHVFMTPNNAGTYDFTVDGQNLTLGEARALLVADEAEGKPKRTL